MEMDHNPTCTGDDHSDGQKVVVAEAHINTKDSSKKRPWPTTTTTPGNYHPPQQSSMASNKNIIGDDDEADVSNKETEHNNSNKGSTSVQQQPKLKKRKHIDPIVLQLRTNLHQCCKRNDLSTAWQLFVTARRENVHIETHVLYNLLSLCDGLGDRPLHIGTPRRPPVVVPTSVAAAVTTPPPPTTTTTVVDKDEIADNDHAKNIIKTETTASPTSAGGEDATNNTCRNTVDAVSDAVRCEYAKQILEYVQQDRHLALTETAYTALTRLHARAGDLLTAEQFLLQAEQAQQCKVKLRLYSPVLLAYCDRRDWGVALRLWARLCQQQKLVLTEREYASLLPSPYLERVLADLIEDVSVPSKQTVQVLRRCLLLNHDDDGGKTTTNDEETKSSSLLWQVPTLTDEMKDCLAQIPAPELQTTLTLPRADHGWVESTNCSIDRSTGVLLSGCLQGVALQAVTLAGEYVQTMLNMNERIVLTGRIDDADATPFQGGGKGKKRVLTERDLQQRQRHWHRFREYMATATGTTAAETTTTTVTNQRPISIVIDGANVGYHEQNYKECPKHVNYEQIDAVVRQFDPRTVLLVLHTRHCSPPLMPDYANRYMDQWKHFLYQTPPGMNDDWFWLHAALETNAMVVTNDHMRDHHFQMVTPRSFLRWRDRHQIYFDFVGGGRNLQVKLTYPDPYSRRIQLVDDGLIVPMPKKGDESRFLDGVLLPMTHPRKKCTFVSDP